MDSSNEMLERIAHRIPVPRDGYERVLRRRDRKRRTQRMTAGVVGIAVFVAAVWLVTSVKSLDRSDQIVVPGRSGVSGPTVTGPTVSLPYDYDPAADFVGLPPKGAQPSGPETSALVAEAHEIHVGWVYVFDDGRVIANASWGGWPLPGFPTEFAPSVGPDGITEQRLTPEGVELVGSGAISASDFICPEKPPSLGGLAIGCQGPLHEIPPSAWEDSTLRPYVPYRYAIGVEGPWRMLPVAAQDLLRGTEAMFELAWTDRKGEAFDITTEKARALDQILADAGFNTVGSTSYERRLHGGSDLESLRVTFEPILPHGTFGSDGGG